MQSQPKFFVGPPEPDRFPLDKEIHMNRLTMMLAIATLAGTAAAQNARQIPTQQADTRTRGQARSQDIPRETQRPRHDKRNHSRRQMVDQFDTDGDGKLSDAERLAAKDAHEQRRAEHRQIMLDRFDADGDGQMSDAERQTARQSFQGQRSQGQRPQGQRGPDERFDGRQNQDNRFQGRGQGDGFEGRAKRPSREEALRLFDADGDGQLSDAERQAAHDQFARRRGDRPDRDFDGDRTQRRFDGDQNQRGTQGNRPPREFDSQSAQQGRRGDRRGPPQEVIDRFDADGDGRLNQAEGRAARAEFQSRRAKAIERFDTNGDGRLNDAEGRAARDAFRQQRTLRAVDTNRDGSLDEAELADAFQKVRAGDMAADFNGDGAVDMEDVNLLIDHAAKK